MAICLVHHAALCSFSPINFDLCRTALEHPKESRNICPLRQQVSTTFSPLFSPQQQPSYNNNRNNNHMIIDTTNQAKHYSPNTTAPPFIHPISPHQPEVPLRRNTPIHTSNLLDPPPHPASQIHSDPGRAYQDPCSEIVFVPIPRYMWTPQRCVRVRRRVRIWIPVRLLDFGSVTIIIIDGVVE